jgi:hypothetical protein
MNIGFLSSARNFLSFLVTFHQVVERLLPSGIASCFLFASGKHESSPLREELRVWVVWKQCAE